MDRAAIERNRARVSEISPTVARARTASMMMGISRGCFESFAEAVPSAARARLTSAAFRFLRMAFTFFTCAFSRAE
jgi:hypothetical protein